MNYIDLKNGIPLRDGGEPKELTNGIQAPDTSDAYAGEGKLHSVIDRLADGTIIEQTKVKNRIIQREIHPDGKVVATYFIQQGQMLYQYDEKVIYHSTGEPDQPTTIQDSIGSRKRDDVARHLKTYAIHQFRIKRLKKELDYLREIIDTGLKDGCYACSPAEISRAKETRDRLVCRMTEEISASERACNHIRYLISTLPDGEMRLVFELYYFEALTFEAIASTTYICLTKVKRLHREGLDLIAQHLNQPEQEEKF